jgi:hypothetical protein
VNINDEDPNDEIRNDADLNRLFAGEVRRKEWKAMIGRLGKAQARLWHKTPLVERLRVLAEVDAADKVSTPQADGDGRPL